MPANDLMTGGLVAEPGRKRLPQGLLCLTEPEKFIAGEEVLNNREPR